jgi:HAMP domain-containing protein
MSSKLRHSVSFFRRSFLSAAAFLALQPSYAAPQSQNPIASLSDLTSEAERGDPIAQYKLA